MIRANLSRSVLSGKDFVAHSSVLTSVASERVQYTERESLVLVRRATNEQRESSNLLVNKTPYSERGIRI